MLVSWSLGHLDILGCLLFLIGSEGRVNPPRSGKGKAVHGRPGYPYDALLGTATTKHCLFSSLLDSAKSVRGGREQALV